MANENMSVYNMEVREETKVFSTAERAFRFVDEISNMGINSTGVFELTVDEGMGTPVTIDDFVPEGTMAN